ncbi:ATP-binding protein [Oceanisphaera arctica]|uniref:C4-dicarboxylate transport sensor protein DctB n=1 Tax=Oceanisphaera arctica TaxID=641510 RepID=A0A2P5TQB8_9GAMM|nr:ATP-binding protein [Oceanisphaera arctica]PPL17876.1 two-component sensor histidine kinase [Oceanisphaera arctica]GHA23758.1 two-component sensor histidine kinase [Oceanisphaera arctica]
MLKKRILWLFGLLLFSLLLLWIWLGSWQRQIAEQELWAQQQLQIYRATLVSEIARFENIPRALQSHPVLTRTLASPNNIDVVTRANQLLEQLAADTGVETLYLMNAQGTVLAASNWQQSYSLVGQNYGFRPYFHDALQGSFGEFYGVGATTGIPGYFFGLQMDHEGTNSGVLAAKITLLELEKSWQPTRDLVMVVDPDQVIALASRTELKFKTLTPLSPKARQRLDRTRQYAPLPLTTLELGSRNGQPVWQSKQYRVSQLDLPRRQWRLQLWWPSRPLMVNATLVTAVAGFSIIAMTLLLLYWRQRRRYIQVQLKAKNELEHKVMERTSALATSNVQLARQVRERTQAEARLRAIQHELIQSNRLAALGQMAASVAHEVNQPLTALKNQSTNTLLLARRGMYPQVEESLQTMGRLVDRMARLTSQLKLFAATRRKTRGLCRLDEALDNVLSWLSPRLDEQQIRLENTQTKGLTLPIELHALEQVLANLICNSLDALVGREEACITLEAGDDFLCLWDNGPGIAPPLLDKVTEPFFSTKEAGQGLGLGLAIVRDLVEASDGRLEITSSPSGGARFTLNWSQDE